MNIRITLLLTSLIALLSCPAYSCSLFKEIEDDSVTIRQDADLKSGVYHVTAPQLFKNHKLEQIILTAYLGSSTQPKEISVPLAIKSKGKISGSFFYMTAQWLNIKVSASYKGLMCTDLIAKLSIN